MNRKKGVKVVKASGQLAMYDEAKLRNSLERSGADRKIIKEILNEIGQGLFDGITTAEIYRKAFEMLRNYSRPAAAKYTLKSALMELGPSGYPFEKYFSEILTALGYTALTNQVLQGKCVQHEIDVVAWNNSTVHYIECKFHNNRGQVTDIKVPLYIHSRFLDVSQKQAEFKENKGKTFKGWVVTNTRFSTDSVQYGNCAGLELVGWDFPQGKGIRELIDITGLHPVTCLTSLTEQEKMTLLNNKVVLVRDLASAPSLLRQAGIDQRRSEIIMREAHKFCQVT